MGKKHEVHEEHENHERWLVSYADFITLLFAFFVVLYAISTVDQNKVRQVESAVRWALHVKGSGAGGEMPLFKESDTGSTQLQVIPTTTGAPDPGKLVQVVRRIVKPGSSRLLVEIDGRKLTVRLPASQVFLPGSAELLPSAFPTIDMIVSELRVLEHPLRIEAHTDVLRARQMSNWELSALRAAAVVRYVESTGLVERQQLSLVGHADTRPVDTANTETAHDNNRRIEFIVEL